MSFSEQPRGLGGTADRWHRPARSQRPIVAVGKSSAQPAAAGRSGQFAGQGIAIKAGMFGAITGMQYAILRLTHSRKAGKAFTVTNSVLGIGYGAIAVRNVRMQGWK
jgi:hypothetical protein